MLLLSPPNSGPWATAPRQFYTGIICPRILSPGYCPPALAGRSPALPRGAILFGFPAPQSSPTTWPRARGAWPKAAPAPPQPISDCRTPPPQPICSSHAAPPPSLGRLTRDWAPSAPGGMQGRLCPNWGVHAPLCFLLPQTQESGPQALLPLTQDSTPAASSLRTSGAGLPLSCRSACEIKTPFP